jgi:flagellar basal body rod protein FlgG
MERGTLSQTDQATDFAIEGEGFFELRDGDQVGFSRNGQLRRDASGRLVDPQGRALQGVGGGDVLVASDRFEVSSDGSILEDGRVVDRIAVVIIAPGAARPGADGLITAAPEEVSPTDQAVVRQGFLESSNVSLGDETIALMEAVRQAETGQRLMNVYDDLMGRAVSTFGQAGQ